MRTVTIDIINKKVLALLKSLEALNLIRIHQTESIPISTKSSLSWFKGALSKKDIKSMD